MRIQLAAYCFFLYALLGCATATESLKKKSSEIPPRREFPINTAVNPCDNFYDYACSEVINSFELREDRSAHTFAFSDSAERLLVAKQKFLAELKNKDKLSARSRELRDVYMACMNDSARAKEERALLAATKSTLAKLTDRRAFLQMAGENMDGTSVSFLSFGTIADHDNPDWYDVYFLSRIKTLPEHSYYENPELMADFRNMLVAFFKVAELDKPEQRADWVIAFESNLMKTYPKPAEIRQLISTKSGVKRADFLAAYPNFYAEKFFKKVPRMTHLRNLTPDNYKALNEALAKTDFEALKSVYLFHEVANDLDDAYPDFYKIKFEFNKKYLGGPNARPAREERCTKMVMSNFTKEIDAELIDQLFPKFPAEKVRSVAEKVRRAIVKGIEANTWLSEQGKVNAARKIRTADLMLVKPRNNEEWDFNPEIDYNPETPIANLRLLDQKLNDKSLEELKHVRNRRQWSMGPLTVNAYYSPSNNHFVLPLGILQYPFYDPTLPEVVNFGAVGAVVGHELGHAIDDRGARYDEKGRLITILSDKDIVEFQKRGASFVDQFKAAGYDGQLTLGENIGDHVGLSFAYEAAFPKNEGKVEDKQAFFLQYARVWCNVARPKFRELQIKTDPHPLGDARVNEQVKHQAGFAEAFSCKQGDRLVYPPEKRVRVW